MIGTPLERLLAEMAEQPLVVSSLLATSAPQVLALAGGIRALKPRAVVLAARGSSDHAATFGRYLLETQNGLLTSLAAPSTRTLYGKGPDLSGCVLIAISQSGRGEDVLEMVRAANAQHAPTIAIVNDEESPLAQEAEHVLALGAGPEVSVPATKTVTAQMTMLAMLSEALNDRGPEALALLPDAIAEALQAREQARALVQQFQPQALAVIGRGYAFPVALELALKLKETSGTFAEAFSAADYLHGPVRLLGEAQSALIIDAGGHTHGPAEQMREQVKKRGAKAAMIRVGGSPGSESEPSLTIRADGIPEIATPIAAVVLGQLYAVERALALGLDPAQPPGLTKVTSTR